MMTTVVLAKVFPDRVISFSFNTWPEVWLSILSLVFVVDVGVGLVLVV